MIIHTFFLNYLFLLFFANYHGNFKISLKNILNKTKATAGYRVIHRVSKNTCSHCRCFFHVWLHRETMLSCLP